MLISWTKRHNNKFSISFITERKIHFNPIVEKTGMHGEKRTLKMEV
jgi:hypothetical protein